MKRLLFHVFGILTAGIVYVVWGVKELINHREYLTRPKKQRNDRTLNDRITKAGIATIVGTVLFVGTIAMGGEEPQQAPEAKPAQQSVETAESQSTDQDIPVEEKPAEEKPKTPEEAVKQLVADELGDTVNVDDKKRVKDVEVSGKTLRITLRADENLTLGWTAKGILDDIRKIGPGLRDILKKHKLEQTQIIVVYPLVDAYGNEREGDVLRVLYDIETMKKINWDNIAIENLPNLSINTFMHPDIRDALEK